MKAAPRDPRETALDRGQDSAEGRLFDPARYSPIQVAIWQRLPDSNARAFAIAHALGSVRHESGSSAPLVSGKQAAGSLVEMKHRKAIYQAIGIGERQFREYVEDWVARYVAHRCGRGIVFLFSRPIFDVCPVCKREIEINRVPPSFRTKRGRGYGNGEGTAERTATEPPQLRLKNGRMRGSAIAATTNGSSIPRSGFHLGLEVGEEVPCEDLKGEDREAFLRAQAVVDEVFQEIAASQTFVIAQESRPEGEHDG